jgi:hypothetical protein
MVVSNWTIEHGVLLLTTLTGNDVDGHAPKGIEQICRLRV